MAIKLTKQNLSLGHSKFMEFAGRELPQRGFKRGLSRLRSEGPRARRLSERWLRKYMTARGITDVGAINWQDFFKFLLENLPAIIEAIMALFD